MDVSQNENWKKAQAISISIDIVEDARRQLVFLASVDRYPCLYQGPAAQMAISRYEECWLPLLASRGVADQLDSGKKSPELVPPLDCEWVWHCHRLNPVRYANDCKRLYGRLLDASPVDFSVKDLAIIETAKLWNNAYPEESYFLDLEALSSAPNHRRRRNCFEAAETPATRKIKYDLKEAMRRQGAFFYQVSWPHMSDESFLRSAEQRYKGFLYIVKNSMAKPKKFLSVPTYDIDLMWHSHQLNPAAYEKDMIELLGMLLEHDDTDTDRGKGKELDVGFAEITREWECIFGTRYWKAGALYRGEPPRPVPRSPAGADALIDISQHEHADQINRYNLPARQTMQVLLEIVRARNVAAKSKGSLFVRYYVQNTNNTLALHTNEVFASSVPEWRHTLSLECIATGNLLSEIRSKLLVFELRLRIPTLVGKLRGSKLLGRVHIPWQALFDSPTLSIENWFVLVVNKQHMLVDDKPPSLHVAVSVTPPVSASYILRSVRSSGVIVSFPGGFQCCFRRTKQHNHMTSCVLDHANNEIFSVQTRYSRRDSSALEDDRRVITVLLKEYKESDCIFDAGTATAEELGSGRNGIEWSLFGNASHLKVKRSGCSNNMIYGLTGELGRPLRLLSGRRLQYEVKKSSTTKDDREGEFVTLVRYTPQNPQGKATALFNWKTGSIEIERTECVMLVVLVSAVVSASVSTFHGSSRPNYTTKALPAGTGQDDRRNNKCRRENSGSGIIGWGVVGAAAMSLGSGCGDGAACGAGCGAGCGA